MAKRRAKLTLTDQAAPKSLWPVSRVVELRSGGRIALSVAVDLFDLSPDDAQFVDQIIGLFRDYGASKEQVPDPPPGTPDKIR